MINSVELGTTKSITRKGIGGLNLAQIKEFVLYLKKVNEYSSYVLNRLLACPLVLRSRTAISHSKNKLHAPQECEHVLLTNS
jgi:hypothetical protein